MNFTGACYIVAYNTARVSLMISIVIPARNEEKLIGGCLESLKNQDFKGEFEVVVVDNGSEDSTADLTRRYGARLVPCSRRGVGHARKTGADAARGNIIVQADADTIYPSDWLSRIDKHFSAQPEAVALAGAFIYRTPPWWAWIEYFLRTAFNLLPVWLFGRPYIISGANFAFRKSALLKIGGYEPESYSMDQYNIATRLSKVGKVIYDRHLKVMTSNRAVQKPIATIAIDFVGHLLKYFGNAMVVFALKLLRASENGPVILRPRRAIAILILVLLIGVLAYGYFVPVSPVFGKVYSQGATPAWDKVIALTFDDGPNEPYTSQVLDILDKYNIEATFFLIGYNVALYPYTARRIRTRHVIGNHTYSHDANHALTFTAIRDIKLAQDVIFEVTGVKPHLYRPPHGKKSPWELMALKKEGMIPVLWSDSTNEFSGRSPAFLAREIIRKSKPGRIVLLHDGYGLNHDDARSNKSLTVEMLPLIIEQLQSEGYRFVTVPEILGVPSYIQVAQ